MATTKGRRNSKTKRAALKLRRHGYKVLTVGVALLPIRRFRRIGLVLIQAGGRIVNQADQTIQLFQHPHAFRQMYPYARRNLDSFHEDQYHDKYRFPKNTVIRHLNFYVRECGFPETIEIAYSVLEHGRQRRKVIRFEIGELYLIFLRYLACPIRQYEVAIEFGRLTNEISRGIKWFHINLAEVSKQYLQSADQPWFDITEARKCAEALRRKDCPIDNCLGNVDGVNKRIARPSDQDLQRETYNGHKRHNGLAWAGCSLPNGMVLVMLGASPGRRHDAAVAAEHNLYEILETLGSFPCGFRGNFGADSAYPLFFPLVPLFRPALTNAQTDFNRMLSSTRVSVEWQFGCIIQQFSSVEWKIRCKVLASPVREAYLNSTFLTNLLNIRFPNQVSQHFECTPPSLEKYLNVPMGSLD